MPTRPLVHSGPTLRRTADIPLDSSCPSSRMHHLGLGWESGSSGVLSPTPNHFHHLEGGTDTLPRQEPGGAQAPILLANEHPSPCSCCQMAAVGITENVKGDVRKFEIWYNAREEVYIVQAPTPEVKAAWVSEIRKVLTSQLQACREASQHRTLEQSQSLPLPTPPSTSPSKGTTRNIKKLEERKTDPLSLEGYMSPSSLPKPPEKGRDDMVTSSTSESSALSRKRFTLQGFANLKGQKASPTSPDKKPKRHEVKSDPTPFGLRGWSKTSHPLEAPEDNDGWSSAEELMNSSDAEEEGRVGPRKLVPGKYTVVVDDEKGSPEALAVRNGDMVEVVQEGDEGLWYVRNLTSSKESWVPASSLSALLGVSGSAQCLSSSESSAGSTLLSASSSCSESCGVPLSDLQG
uniref:MCF.2 cell line derived transforming sequence like n=1 Tax=Canis lupus familiaris TaxID=9615 RepID=A0A8I3PZI3_CANLF